jgi:hypothetical protein
MSSAVVDLKGPAGRTNSLQLTKAALTGFQRSRLGRRPRVLSLVVRRRGTYFDGGQKYREPSWRLTPVFLNLYDRKHMIVCFITEVRKVQRKL